MRRKLSISLMAFCLAVGMTVGTWGTDIQRVEASNKAAEGKQKLKDIKTQQNNTKENISKVEQEILTAQQNLHKIEQQMEDLENQIGQLNQNIESTQKLVDKQRQILGSKLKRIYVQGENEYMAQLLTSESFNQFLTRLELLRLIVHQDYVSFHNYMVMQNKLESQKKAVEQKKQALAKMAAQANQAVDQYEQELSKHKDELKKLQEQEKAVLKQYAGYFNSGGGELGRPTTPGMVYWNFMQWRGDHYHKGVDFPRPKGTPIYAAEDGVVTGVRTDPGGYGVYIDIDHGHGLSTRYAHMFMSTVVVSPGEHVQRGQLIARVGNNGRYIGATGYHLHFEVHVNGKPVNPRPYLQ
jgi:murein DD-endopeptidase MepM/ murein hydrolase activator NlpD